MYMKTVEFTEVTAHMDGNIDSEVFEIHKPENEVRAWASLAATIGQRNKIEAIKLIRDQFNLGLRNSKAFVDSAIREF